MDFGGCFVSTAAGVVVEAKVVRTGVVVIIGTVHLGVVVHSCSPESCFLWWWWRLR